jgi:predicted ATPase/DNA-binding SARP family transcriptional activator
MEFRVLGPFEVLNDGAVVPVSAAKQRALLMLLLLRAGTTVSGRRLIEDLWEHPPVSARKVLQTYVSKLRQVLPDGMLLTRPTGYTLLVGPDDLDAARFQRLLVASERAVVQDEAQLLRQALDLWRGSALEDFADEPYAQPEIARLEELRNRALVRRCELDLQAGRHLAVLGELEALVQGHPTDEKLRGQLMLALYRSGRQVDALRVFRDGRKTLVEQLGVEPSEPLRRLHDAVLRHDSSLDLGQPSRPVDQSNTDGAQASGRPDAVLQPRTSRPRVTTFVGRTTELERLRHLVHDSPARLVTLTGSAGTGKTRLAAELVAQLQPQYADGAMIADLADVSDPELVASAVCAAFRLRPGEPEEARATLTRFLSTRRQLLMLDNFEHLLPASGLVTHLLMQSPGLTVLVTSRTPLDVAEEHAVAVPPLPVPGPGSALDVVAATDAVVLFLDRARSARPGFELTDASTTTVGQLCGLLDGLPLAIELAAARVDLLSPAAILTRLDRQLDLLADDRPGQRARHRSLRAAIDTSYDLLGQREQDVFCDLSVFAGGFTVATAETVVSAGSPLLVDVVRSLLRASLLHPAGAPGDEPRFEMLQTVRTYSRDQLERTGRRANLCDAHASAYRRLAEEAEPQLRGPDQARWLDLVQAELPNIRQALQWAMTGGNLDRGLHTAAGLWRFWQVRGHTHEARRYLEAMLAGPSGSAEARASGNLAVAQCAFAQGDSVVVQEHAHAAMDVHRRRGDTRAVAFGLALLGASAGRAGDAAHGEPLLREAMDLASAARDEWLVAMCLGYLGMTVSTQGRYTEARHRLEDGLRGARQNGDSRLVGWFLTNLGQVALADGDPVRAKRRFAEALTWERRLADDWSEAWALQGLASVAIHDGAIAEAVDLLIQSLVVAERAQSQPATASALGLLATVAFAGGLREFAAQLFGAGNLVWPHERFHWSLEQEPLAGVAAATVRASLGPEQYDEHWAIGRAQTIDHMIAAARQLLTQ